MPFFHHQHGKTHYEIHGQQGPLIALGHGHMTDIRWLRDVALKLSDSFRVLIWDSRNHGRTEFARHAEDLWELADDLAALLKHLGISKAIIGGFSMGGYVAQRFALRYTQETMALILIATLASRRTTPGLSKYDTLHRYWKRHGPTKMIEQLFKVFMLDGEWDGWDEWAASIYQRPSDWPEETHKAIETRDDIQHLLPDITVPGLVIRGEHDLIINPRHVRKMSEALGGAVQRVTIQNAGHGLMVTHPEQVSEQIQSFVHNLSS